MATRFQKKLAKKAGQLGIAVPATMKSPVSERAIVQRINRFLAATGGTQHLAVARNAPNASVRYWLAPVNDPTHGRWIDPWEYAHDHSLLKPWESRRPEEIES